MHDDPLAQLGTRLADGLRAATGPPPEVELMRRRRTTRRLGTLAAAALLLAGALIGLPQLLGGLEGPMIDPVSPREDEAPPPEELPDGVEVRDPGEQPDGIEVVDLDLDIEVPVRLLAVRFNNPSLATFDLDTGQATVYPPGSHGLSGDAISGALVTSEGTIVVWQDDTVRVFTDRLDEPSFEYTPSEMINPQWAAPTFRVLPTPDGRALWVAQIGSGGSEEFDGLAELVDLGSGQVLTRVELPPDTSPAGFLGEDLILNAASLQPTDTVPVRLVWAVRVLVLTPDGQLSDLTDGDARTPSGSTVLIRTCDDHSFVDGCSLDLLDTTTGQRRPVEPDSDGVLSAAAGPDVPGDFTAWDVVAPDGRILVAITTGDYLDDEPMSSRLLVLDPDTAQLTEVASYDGPPRPAAWDREGRHIVVADGRDLTILDPISGITITLDDVIPESHYVVGIG